MPTTSASQIEDPVGPSSPKRQKMGIEASFSKILEFGSGGSKNKQIADAIAQLIYRDNFPFSVVEGEGFGKLIKLRAPIYKILCRKTITGMIDGKYEEKKAIIINKLQSVTNICLTIDKWKDLQMKSYLGVTIHFIKNFKIVSFNIACEPLSESHTAEYLSTTIKNICEKWEIPEVKIVAVTTDNGANIVKAIEFAFRRAKHIRCIAHTLNLVVQNSVMVIEIKLFIDKVRKIVQWFHQSGVGADQLMNSQKAANVPEGKIKHLIGDVSTRWNSQLHMLERFLAMSRTVGGILLNHPNAPPMIQASEIAVLKEVVKILKPFEKVTEEMCSEKYVSASKAIPMIKCLKQYLEKTDPSHDLAIQLKSSLLNEFKKRFEHIQKVHLFTTATFLDPRFKKLHLDDGASLTRTINYIRRSIEENREPEHCALSITSAADEVDNDDIWETHNKLFVETMKTSQSYSQTSELSLYIAAPLIELKEDALESWRRYEGAYPQLTQLACKHLLVPASSAPAKRLFSKAGAILTKTKSRILSKRLPKLLFLNSLPTDF
ncbi:E3 SUMO-protein ligase ZBED1-like [Neodiprion lecontei]|uniref:E3 SUMO-protein ligase ZBED1-like n=1 Tax=Neodiprion lecontei TaxID=441921 RepID=A0ABM3GBK5_NEOLC|nr:E3 SUMO-protein ligase ZBED1-like [Neodiprion lecontei]